MIQRFKSSGLVWPTVFTIVGLAVLVSLGNWQWSRMHWKAGLIAQIEARTAPGAAALPLAEIVGRAARGEDVSYFRTRAQGTLRGDKVRWLYANGPEGSGWHAYVPLELTDERGFVWINRGYVPDPAKQAAADAVKRASGGVTVTGLTRTPEASKWFVPESDPNANVYYGRRLQDMSSAVFDEPMPDVMPFSIDAETVSAASATRNETASGLGQWPRPGTTIVKLTNKHFGYAMTWWGLALTLIGVYAAFAAQRLAGGRAKHDDETGART